MLNSQSKLQTYQILFSLWILCLPFNRLSIIGDLSADNILAPFVFIAWLFSGHRSSSLIRNKRLVTVIVLYAFFSFFAVLGLLLSGSPEQIFSAIWTQLKYGIYFLLPILCIRTPQQFHSALKLLLIDTVIVCGTAIADSLGFLSLKIDIGVGAGESGRRFGLGIGRSAGIVGGNGPLAALISFSSLLLISGLLTTNKSPLKKRVIQTTITLSLLLGIAASQSRNVILSTVLAIFFYTILKKLYTSRGSSATKTLVTIAAIIIFSLAGIAFFPMFYSTMMGTGDLTATMLDRFLQYYYALGLVGEYPVLGLPGPLQEQHFKLILSIHNLWLGLTLQGGTLTLLSFSALIFYSITTINKMILHSTNKTEGIISASIIIVLCFAANFYVAHHDIFFWTIFGLAVSYTCIVWAHEHITPKASLENSYRSRSVKQQEMLNLTQGNLQKGIIRKKNAALLRHKDT